MASTTVVFGAVLIVLGLAGFLSTSGEVGAALVPALFGLALLIAGVFAIRESTKQTALQIGVGLGLFGCLGSFPGAAKLPSLLNGSAPRPLAVQLPLAMFVICAVYVWLWVRAYQEEQRQRMGPR